MRTKWATTTALQNLSDRDIISIVDSHLREDVLRHVKEKSNGRKLTIVLQEYADKHQIRSVRYFPKGQVPVPISSNHNKAYLPYDFYRVDIWLLPGKTKKYEGVFISRTEYFQQKRINQKAPIRKPHPAAKLMMSLHKNDVVEILSPQINELARIAGYATTKNLIDIRPIAAADSIADWTRNTKPELTTSFWPRDCDGQNFKSINMLFTTYTIKQVNITVEGRLSTR